MDENEGYQWLYSLWPHLLCERFLKSDYDRVFTFIESERNKLVLARPEVLPIESTAQITSILNELAKIDKDSFTRTNTISAASRILSDCSVSQAALLELLDVALRIMLTLDVRSSPLDRSGLSAIEASFITWDQDASLSQSISSHFEHCSSTSFRMRSGRIDPAMTMAYLSASRDFTVLWTSSLVEHLSINWKSRVITVYEHKIYLWNHLNSPTNVIPKAILLEAIDTLNLLFPLNDTQTREFLKRNGKPFYGLGYCKREKCLDVEKFHYWKARVTDLMEVMNEEPRGLQQLVLSGDGRNLLSFATFWIATIVAILTIISIVFGTVQTVFAVKQYNLAVAQACAAPGAVNTLAQYCS